MKKNLVALPTLIESEWAVTLLTLRHVQQAQDQERDFGVVDNSKRAMCRVSEKSKYLVIRKELNC